MKAETQARFTAMEQRVDALEKHVAALEFELKKFTTGVTLDELRTPRLPRKNEAPP